MQIQKVKISHKNVTYSIAIFYIFLVFSIIYHVAFSRKIIPGVKIGSIAVGGKTYNEAKKALVDYESATDKNLILKFEDNEFSFKGEDVGLTYNWDAAVSRAYEVGRTGNLLVDTKDKLAGLVKPIYIAAFYDYDEDLFHARFAQIQGEINKEAHDAGFTVPVKGQLDATEATGGRKVSTEDLFKMIISSFDRVAFSPKELPVEKIIPKVTKRDVEPFIDQAKKIINNPLVITYKGKRWTLTTEQKLELISLDKNEDSVDLSLNKPIFEAFADSIALEINEFPRGRVVETDGEKVIKFEITQDGRELDDKKFTKDFKTAFFSALPLVELSLKEESTSMSPEKYGIFALLGEGTSKFHGSINARVNNLALAAQRTDGVLIPPNGTYSMNKSIGEISGATGYDAAYIIKGGRTVLGEGGGVCQTSTTMFRAVLNSGLPVVMRYPHAYRVRYYEEDSAPGFDASIYQPTLDFQFKNDTQNYVLIQTTVDRANYGLSFKIYGTPDGRSVEISEPVITSQIAPGAPQNIDDPTLEKGRIIQTEWPAWGANVSFTRTVKRGGEVLNTSTFTTRYQPWKAVYRVGTKE